MVVLSHPSTEQVSGAHWPACLAHLTNYRSVIEPASENKVEDTQRMTPVVLVNLHMHAPALSDTHISQPTRHHVCSYLHRK